MPYLRADQVLHTIESLAAAYPANAHPIDLPHRTAEGRACRALILSTRPNHGRDAVLVVGGLHACEWGSSEIALNLAQMLLAANKANAGLGFGGELDVDGHQMGGSKFAADDIRRLWNERDIIVFPLVNPDGREYSQISDVPGARVWRKNRRPVKVNGQLAGIGVDLNRNFDFVFDLGHFAVDAAPVASTDPQNDYFQGEQPLCEAETQNIVWLLDTRPHIGWMVDLHSAGLQISHPWNHDDLQSVDQTQNFRSASSRGRMGRAGTAYGEFIAPQDLADMRRLADRFAHDATAVNASPYRTAPGFWKSPYPGTSHDYAYARHLVDSSRSKVLGFSCEWGDMNPQPPWSQMEPIVAEVTAGLVAFCLETLNRAP